MLRKLMLRKKNSLPIKKSVRAVGCQVPHSMKSEPETNKTF